MFRGRSDKGVWDPGSEPGRAARLLVTRVPLLLVRFPLCAV